MLQDTLTPKIELLQEQIESIERSGHFTEKEIDSKAAPFHLELASLKMQESHSETTNSLNKYGMTLESYVQGLRAFNECFSQIPTLSKNLLNINVIDANLLIPNHTKA